MGLIPATSMSGSRVKMPDSPVLGLEPTATLQDVKKRYKQLVKRYHPDVTGSGNDPDSASKDAATADRLRDIIQVYSHLIESGLLANPV